MVQLIQVKLTGASVESVESVTACHSRPGRQTRLEAGPEAAWGSPRPCAALPYPAPHQATHLLPRPVLRTAKVAKLAQIPRGRCSSAATRATVGNALAHRWRYLQAA
eukprot:COSAG01_NODE_48035_length_384_cov_2.466667_1_plen_106_part_10